MHRKQRVKKYNHIESNFRDKQSRLERGSKNKNKKYKNKNCKERESFIKNSKSKHKQNKINKGKKMTMVTLWQGPFTNSKNQNQNKVK